MSGITLGGASGSSHLIGIAVTQFCDNLGVAVAAVADVATLTVGGASSILGDGVDVVMGVRRIDFLRQRNIRQRNIRQRNIG